MNLGRFQDSFHEMLHEDESLDKESNALVRIIKPPPIKLVKHHLTTHVLKGIFLLQIMPWGK
jgi:hypothetical protein